MPGWLDSDPTLTAEQTRLVDVALVGSYAIAPAWADGHHTGYYTFTLLRDRCPCPECTPDGRSGTAAVDRRSPRGARMIVVTTPYLAGHRIIESKGMVFGLVVRSRGLGGNLMASLRSLGGGEIHEYTSLLEDTRRQALDRLVKNATLLGANAVLSMRFDSSELSGTMSEIVAYGTAVVVEPDAGRAGRRRRRSNERWARRRPASSSSSSALTIAVAGLVADRPRRRPAARSPGSADRASAIGARSSAR